MNDIFYHITSATLSWNPFIHFLHTIHIIPPPDTVTVWHILCLIYFSCTIQVLIKQEHRSPHSWCHYTNFQKGVAPLSLPLQSDHRALSLARGPVTLLPIFGFLDTSQGSLKTTGLKTFPPPLHTFHWPHGKFSLLPVPTQSLDKWNICYPTLLGYFLASLWLSHVLWVTCRFPLGSRLFLRPRSPSQQRSESRTELTSMRFKALPWRKELQKVKIPLLNYYIHKDQVKNMHFGHKNIHQGVTWVVRYYFQQSLNVWLCCHSYLWLLIFGCMMLALHVSLAPLHIKTAVIISSSIRNPLVPEPGVYPPPHPMCVNVSGRERYWHTVDILLRVGSGQGGGGAGICNPLIPFL